MFFFQFQIYNTILRQWPEDVFKSFQKGKNFFTTTIHVLVSAVQKLSRFTKLLEDTVLFRGLGGTIDLPAHFLTADGLGCRGYAEWGFMSTTANKDVALQYSGVREGKPLAAALVVKTGGVDRGASLVLFSQYQGEKEFLWLPLSFLQPDGDRFLQVTADGVVSMVPVRVIPNQKSSTLEEALERKKTMHIVAFKHILRELRDDLNGLASKADAGKRLDRDGFKNYQGTHTVEKLTEWIMAEGEKTLQRHEARGADDYVKDEVFRGLVIEMLESKTMAMSHLRLWLEDESQAICFMITMPLRVAHRGLLAFLKRKMQSKQGAARQAAGVEVSKLKGLLQEGVDERNELGEPRLVQAAADGLGKADLQLLMDAGAMADVIALQAAARNGHPEAVTVLLEGGVGVNAATMVSGRQSLLQT